MQDDKNTPPPVPKSSEPRDPFIGITLAGKYRVDDYLKKGGMGTVYLGTHLMLNKKVAIKLIKPELVTSRDIVERFQREAIAASRLDHPNIVTIYDLGQADDGTLYIAMELVAGRSLKDLIVSEGPLDMSRAIELVTKICSALTVAHNADVIHRDLKPQNIMVYETTNGSEVPKLLDFGIAKTFETDGPALTSTGMVLGTPQYMSPEQAKGLPVDKRSDLYALGIILYEMLTGKVPFNDTSVPAVLVKHLNEQPVPPSQIRADLKNGAEAVVLRCLEKEPDARYQDAESLAQALNQVDLDEQTHIVTPVAEVTAPPSTIPAAAGHAESIQTEIPSSPQTEPPSLEPDPVPPPAPRMTRPTAPVAPPSTRKGGSGIWIVLAVAALLFLVVGGSAAYFVGKMFLGAPPAELSADDASLDPDGEQAGADPVTGSPDGGADTANPTSGDTGATGSTSAAGEMASGAAEVAEATEQLGQTIREVQEQVQRAGEEIQSQANEATEAAVAASLPAKPTVLVECDGVRDGCASVRNALQAALTQRGIRTSRNPAQAQIHLRVFAEEVESRQETQFGTTFVTRTYSIDAEADSVPFSEGLTMPSPAMVSFDTRFGRDKLDEQSRVYAASLAEEIDSYWSSK